MEYLFVVASVIHIYWWLIKEKKQYDMITIYSTVFVQSNNITCIFKVGRPTISKIRNVQHIRIFILFDGASRYFQPTIMTFKSLFCYSNIVLSFLGHLTKSRLLYLIISTFSESSLMWVIEPSCKENTVPPQRFA